MEPAGLVVLATIGIGLFVWASVNKSNEEREAIGWLDQFAQEHKGSVVDSQKSSLFENFLHRIEFRGEGSQDAYIRTYRKKEGEDHLWYHQVGCSCRNPQNLSLQIHEEGMMSGFGKMLGMQDIEIFNEFFDDRFIIKCSHKLFPLECFSTEFCKQFSSVYGSDNQHFKVEGSDVFFLFKSAPNSESGAARLRKALEVCKMVSSMVGQY